MTTSIGVGGAQRPVVGLAVGVSGAWRTVIGGWIGVAGTWRKFFGDFTVDTSATAESSYTVAGSSINPQIRFQTDGTTLARQSNNSLLATDPWGTPTTPGIGANYWINVSAGSGNVAYNGTSDPTGTWLQLNVERTWAIIAPSIGNVNSRTSTYQIALDAAGAFVVGGGTLLVESDRS